jgi:drug/metabolite transporter (DMT)-like permease
MQRGVDRFTALATAIGSGMVVLNLVLLIGGDIGVYLRTEWRAIAALLTAGAFNAVALISLTTAFSLTSVARASTINSLQNALAPLFAWLFLGEQMNVVTALGITLAAGGVVVVQRAGSRVTRASVDM